MFCNVNIYCTLKSTHEKNFGARGREISTLVKGEKKKDLMPDGHSAFEFIKLILFDSLGRIRRESSKPKVLVPGPKSRHSEAFPHFFSA